MAPAILVTGFCPFPGAPFNPTGPLVQRLARCRLGRTNLIAHIFPTSYSAIDNDLPKLIARHKPHALLMFGLAIQARTLRIETRARNAFSRLADTDRVLPGLRVIAPGRAPTLALPTPSRKLLGAARAARTSAVISNDAGDYLCNYLCWRAALAAQRYGGPHIAAFIHVPLRLNPDDLVRAGQALLTTMATICR
jgi:pyroglutamyl-peptidase